MTIALQVPVSMGFPRQEYWSRLPFPSQEIFVNPGMEPVSPALQVDFFFTSVLPGKPPIEGIWAEKRYTEAQLGLYLHKFVPGN